MRSRGLLEEFESDFCMSEDATRVLCLDISPVESFEDELLALPVVIASASSASSSASFLSSLMSSKPSSPLSEPSSRLFSLIVDAFDLATCVCFRILSRKASFADILLGREVRKPFNKVVFCPQAARRTSERENSNEHAGNKIKWMPSTLLTSLKVVGQVLVRPSPISVLKGGRAEDEIVDVCKRFGFVALQRKEPGQNACEAMKLDRSHLVRQTKDSLRNLDIHECFVF